MSFIDFASLNVDTIDLMIMGIIFATPPPPVHSKSYITATRLASQSYRSTANAKNLNLIVLYTSEFEEQESEVAVLPTAAALASVAANSAAGLSAAQHGVPPVPDSDAVLIISGSDNAGATEATPPVTSTEATPPVTSTAATPPVNPSCQ